MLRCLTAVCAASLLLVSTAAAASMTHTEASLLREMNRARARYGLRPFRVDVHLERAARAHTQAMIHTNTFSHGAFATRMQQFDVRGGTTGENLAWGTSSVGTPHAIVEAWLASPEHRANLLRPTFTRVGVADVVASFLGRSGAHVVTADFAG